MEQEQRREADAKAEQELPLSNFGHEVLAHCAVVAGTIRNVALDLHGLYLSDDLSRPLKWQLPDTTVTARGYLIIWGQSNTQNTTAMQANFRLSKEGEQIGLFDRDTWNNLPIDTLSFGPQEPDVSLARVPNGTGDFQLSGQASPSWGNDVPASDFDESGVVDFADFLLFASHFGLSREQEGYEFRYDLDLSGEVDFSDFLIFAESFGGG